MQSWNYVTQHILLSPNTTGIIVIVIIVKMVFMALKKPGLTMTYFCFLFSCLLITFFLIINPTGHALKHICLQCMMYKIF